MELWNKARVRDHPRVCGEHRLGVLAVLIMSGIIPAYAGNTSIDGRIGQKYWDHPRVCGEHAFDDAEWITVEGSSPRMRGTHVFRSIGDNRAGIIPAYAGNTSA